MMQLPWLRALYRRHLAGFAIAAALAVLTLVAGVALLGVSGWFIAAAALAPVAAIFNLFGPSAGVRGLSMLRIGSRYAERLSGHSVTLRLLADLREQIFRGLAGVAPAELARLEQGDVVARLTTDVDALDAVFLQVMAPLASLVMVGTILAVIMASLVPLAGAVMLLAVLVVAVLLPLVVARRTRAAGAGLAQAGAALRATWQEAVDGHADWRALGALDTIRARHAQAAQQFQQARLALGSAAAAAVALMQVLAGATTLGVLVVAVPAVVDQSLSGPLLISLVLMTLGWFEGAVLALRGVTRWGVAQTAAARVDGLLTAPAGPADPAQPQALPATGSLACHSVRVQRAGRAVLDGVSLQVAPGERVAILGASGVGKSTLLQVLLRDIDPDAGEVSFGGVALQAAPLAEVHARLAWLGQQAPVFLGTLRENLCLAAPEATDAELWAALHAARLGDWVQAQPAQLDTWVGEGGASLSVGQARRVCLARVLLSPAAVLVLDEPTRGLDVPAQQAFLEDMAAATRGRSVVLVTHARLPAAAVDRVLILRDGKLWPGASTQLPDDAVLSGS